MNSESSSSRSQSPANERLLLEAWKPEPLVPKIKQEDFDYVLKPQIVSSKPTLYTELANGKKCLNLATPNFLDLAGDERLEIAAKNGVAKYGVGSCGPRAFYGTMNVHLQLENEIAEFLQVEEALLYSFGFSTIASAIPAYAKAKDIIFADECCNFAIQQGMVVSRATIVLFNHNDTNHLRQLVSSYGHEFFKKNRTFIIVEGLYERTGKLCPLKEIIEIKKEFKIRLFIDESNSIGVLGSTGRGLTEHYNVNIKDIDLLMGSLENALCSYGGFCAGSSYVVDHQRIAGSGYIFSASLPPFQVLVAIEALKIIKENPEIVNNAQETFKRAHKQLSSLPNLKLISDIESPIKHFVPTKFAENCYKLTSKVQSDSSKKQMRYDVNSCSADYLNSVELFKSELKELKKLSDDLLSNANIMTNVSRYILDEELTLPLPSLKVMLPGSAVDLSALIAILAKK